MENNEFLNLGDRMPKMEQLLKNTIKYTRRFIVILICQIPLKELFGI